MTLKELSIAKGRDLAIKRMASSVSIDNHAAAGSHVNNLSKAQRPAGRGPVAIDIKVDIASGFVPESRVVGKPQRYVYAPT